MVQLREDLSQPELFVDAQTDKLPRDLLKAALNEEMSPSILLHLRFELVQGAVEAVALFGLKDKVLRGLPGIHPDWMHCNEEEHVSGENDEWARREAGIGGGSHGSREIVRLQRALVQMRALHLDTQEAMQVETRVAQDVLNQSMAAAPMLAGPSQERHPLSYSSERAHTHTRASHPTSRGQGEREHERGRRGDDDGTASIVSATSRRSAHSIASLVSFTGGFDLSAALENTQHALFGVPAPSASAVAGKAPLPVAGASVPRSLQQQQTRGPAHENLSESGSAPVLLGAIGREVAERQEGMVASGGVAQGGGAGEGGEIENMWADAEPDTVWSDEEDRASEMGSSKSYWSTGHRARGAESSEAVVRQSLTRPRLLRQLLEEVVLVCLGDGFSIALCNKKEAGSGVLAAQELRVSSKVRHQARVAQRAFEAQSKQVCLLPLSHSSLCLLPFSQPSLSLLSLSHPSL